jgi:hypothetical protein
MLTANPPGDGGAADGPGPLARVPEKALRAELRRRRQARQRDVRASARSATGVYVDTPVFLDVVGRMLAAAGRRVGEVDLDGLPALAALARDADRVLGEAVWALHGRGCSWTEIGQALGIRAQSAWYRFQRYRPAGTGEEGRP